MRLLLALGVFCCAALAIPLATTETWGRLDEMRAEIAALQGQNREIQLENRALAREAELLRTDPAALERVARRDYGLVAPDERVLLLDAPEARR